MQTPKSKRKLSRPRHITIPRAFRVTPDENRTLAKRAKALGINVSELIRLRLADDIRQAA